MGSIFKIYDTISKNLCWIQKIKFSDKSQGLIFNFDSIESIFNYTVAALITCADFDPAKYHTQLQKSEITATKNHLQNNICIAPGAHFLKWTIYNIWKIPRTWSVGIIILDTPLILHTIICQVVSNKSKYWLDNRLWHKIVKYLKWT